MFGKLTGNLKSGRKKCILFLLLFFFVGICKAKQDSIPVKKYTIEFQLFANTNYISQHNEESDFKFNIKRSMLVYKQHLLPKMSFCLAGDTYTKNNDKFLKRVPYLKRAYVNYRIGNIAFTAGLLVLEHFKYQRKIWGLRYLEKTFQNKFKYGKNRSIGVLMTHNLNRYFSYDFAITSGYDTPVKYASRKYQFMTGQTFSTNFCSFRLFNNISIAAEYEHVISLFVTKNIKSFNFGIEGARKFSNHDQVDEDKYGFSAFGNYSFSNKLMCFARYDTNKELKNRYAENLIWGGFQYSFNKHLNASVYYKSDDFNKNFFGLALFFYCS